MPTKKTGKAPAKKAATKKALAKKGAVNRAVKKNAANGRKSKAVRVRMYRQGLGDCFFLTFPRKPDPFHMLIDCGALKSKHYGSEEMKEVVRDIQSTIKDEMATRSRGAKASFDAVAVTHEHWDHISGFSDAKEVFDEMDFKKVWVAWTEEPENAAAAQLKKEFKKKKKAVENALALIPEEKKDKQLGDYKKAITELFGFFGMIGASDGGGRQTTDGAWNYVLGKGRKQYCDPKKRPIEIEGVEGVRVYVLGPPEDPAYVRMKLSKKETYDEGKQGLSLFDSFMAAVAGDDDDFPGAKDRAFPFDASYRVTKPEESPNANFFKSFYGFGEGDEGEWRRIDHDWLNMAGELALHLDSYTNNTCLAFAIEIGEPGKGKVMLFPGDAQVGNWLSWGDLSWDVKDSDGKKQKVDIVDLLERTVLYKVGHHGSHNATMREKGLERMLSPELVAMIPVHRKTAEDQAWEFPYPPLWKRLKEKARGRVLLADAPDISEIDSDVNKMLSVAERRSFETATTFNDLYIEYRIPY